MAGKKGMKWARSVTSPTALEEYRRRVQAVKIIEALRKHVLGEEEMSATQVAAGLGLLRKVIPDLAATEHTFDANVAITIGVESVQSKLLRELAVVGSGGTLEHAHPTGKILAGPRVELLGAAGPAPAEGVFEREQDVLAGESGAGMGQD